MLRCPGCSGTGTPAARNAPALTRAGSRRPGACHGTNMAPRSTAGTTYPAAGSARIADLPLKATHPAEHPAGRPRVTPAGRGLAARTWARSRPINLVYEILFDK